MNEFNCTLPLQLWGKLNIDHHLDSSYITASIRCHRYLFLESRCLEMDYCVATHCCGNVLTKPLSSNGHIVKGVGQKSGPCTATFNDLLCLMVIFVTIHYWSWEKATFKKYIYKENLLLLTVYLTILSVALTVLCQIVWQLVNNELGRMWKTAISGIWSAVPSISMDGLTNTKKLLSEHPVCSCTRGRSAANLTMTFAPRIQGLMELIPWTGVSVSSHCVWEVHSLNLGKFTAIRKCEFPSLHPGKQQLETGHELPPC
jgi:hypothetical protein